MRFCDFPVCSRLIFPAYSIGWRIICPFLVFSRRIRDGFGERLVPDNWAGDFPQGGNIWIQAASGGETYLLLHLWHEFDKLYFSPKHMKLVATTCTRQGMDLLRQAVLGKLHSLSTDSISGKIELFPRFFPFDEPAIMQRAMSQARPHMLILLETEIWPGLLLAARRADVPVIIVNGRITPKSFAAYRILPSSFWKAIAPQRILAVSQSDAARFSELFSESDIELMSNIKFDLLHADTIAFEPQKIVYEDFNRKKWPQIVLFASLRKQEAPLIAAAISRLQQLNPQCLIVLAPRHLHNIKIWQKHIRLIGRRSFLRSQIETDPDVFPVKVLDKFIGQMDKDNFSERKIIIWDKFGDLKQLYSLASAVFVGGSLIPLGGQNFLEAIEQGITPCLGPHWTNFSWAADAVDDFCHIVHNPEELAFSLNQQMSCVAEREKIKIDFAAFIRSHQGGTQRAVQAMFEFLDR